MSTNQDEAFGQLDAALVKLFTLGSTHADITSHIRTFATHHFKNMAPRKVLYSNSYGGIGIGPKFEAYLEKANIECRHPKYRAEVILARDDPKVFQALIGFGKEACARLPHVYDELRTYQFWEMDRLNRFGNPEELEKKFGADLVVKFKAIPTESVLENDHEFEDFATKSPQDWILHPRVNSFHTSDRSRRLAHILLRDEREKYFVLPDEEKDEWAYEQVGLFCATDGLKYGGKLAIAMVPAGVTYKIEEYDGLEKSR